MQNFNSYHKEQFQFATTWLLMHFVAVSPTITSLNEIYISYEEQYKSKFEEKMMAFFAEAALQNPDEICISSKCLVEGKINKICKETNFIPKLQYSDFFCIVLCKNGEIAERLNKWGDIQIIYAHGEATTFPIYKSNNSQENKTSAEIDQEDSLEDYIFKKDLSSYADSLKFQDKLIEHEAKKKPEKSVWLIRESNSKPGTIAICYFSYKDSDLEKKFRQTLVYLKSKKWEELIMKKGSAANLTSFDPILANSKKEEACLDHLFRLLERSGFDLNGQVTPSGKLPKINAKINFQDQEIILPKTYETSLTKNIPTSTSWKNNKLSSPQTLFSAIFTEVKKNEPIDQQNYKELNIAQEDRVKTLSNIINNQTSNKKNENNDLNKTDYKRKNDFIENQTFNKKKKIEYDSSENEKLVAKSFEI